MELISVGFPSGPVKVFHFFFCIFFLPPTTTTTTASLSSFIMAAHQELRDNQLAEHPWLPFEGCDYDDGLKLLLWHQVDPLVFHCCWLRAIRQSNLVLFYGLLPFSMWRVMKGTKFFFGESMHQKYPLVLHHCCWLYWRVPLTRFTNVWWRRITYFTIGFVIYRMFESCLCVGECSQVVSIVWDLRRYLSWVLLGCHMFFW